MDSKVINALTAEREELRKKLEELDSIQHRLEAVENLLAVYGVKDPSVSRDQKLSKNTKVLSKQTAPEALGIIRNHISNRNYPTPTKELLKVLESHGFVVRGKNPVTNLSAVLSRSAHFRSVGRSGWVYDAMCNEQSSEIVELETDNAAAAAPSSLSRKLS